MGKKNIRCTFDLPVSRAGPSWRAEDDTYATVRDDQLDGEGRELEVVVDQAPPEDDHYQTPKLSRCCDTITDAKHLPFTLDKMLNEVQSVKSECKYG